LPAGKFLTDNWGGGGDMRMLEAVMTVNKRVGLLTLLAFAALC
jgi:hypothetical protein